MAIDGNGKWEIFNKHSATGETFLGLLSSSEWSTLDPNVAETSILKLKTNESRVSQGSGPMRGQGSGPNIVLWSDSLSPCEPWESEWDSGVVTVSCLPTCLSALSDCTTLQVTGADDASCSGDYIRLPSHVTSLYTPGMPAYKMKDQERYLFSSGTQWVIADYIGGAAFHSSGGECY